MYIRSENIDGNNKGFKEYHSYLAYYWGIHEFLK